MAMQRAAQRASELLGSTAHRLQQLRGAKSVTTKLTVEMLEARCHSAMPRLPCSLAAAAPAAPARCRRHVEVRLACLLT